MRRSERKARSEKRKATVTEKTHLCKNQTRKDGAPDPQRKAKSEKRKAKSEKRKAKSEKQIPHTARKRRERVRDDSTILRAGFPRGSGQRMTVLVLRIAQVS